MQQREEELVLAIAKLARAGERAGLSVEDMIQMLDAGATVETLLDLLGRQPSRLARLPLRPRGGSMRLTLERAILSVLQHQKDGCTVEELYEDIGEPIGVILAMLELLSRENRVRMSDEGIWTLTRDSTTIR